MGNKNNSKNQVSQQVSNKGTNNMLNAFTKEEMIEINAEAQYRAMKRLEQEKKEQALKEQMLKENSKKEQHQHNDKRTKREIIKSNLQFYFCPAKAYEKYGKGINYADNFTVGVISFIWHALGRLLRISFYFTTIGTVIHLCREKWAITTIMPALVIFGLGFLALMFGNLCIYIGKDIEKVRDTDTILGHSSNFLAILAIVLSIVLSAK